MSSRLFGTTGAFARYDAVPPVTAAPLTMLVAAQVSILSGTQTLFIIPQKAVSNHKFQLGLGNTGLPFFTVGAGSVQTASPTNAVVVNTPFVAIAREVSAASRSCILDGVLASQGTNTTSVIPLSIDRLSFGGRDDSNGTGALQGVIFYGALWNASLTDDEVTALGTGLAPPPLIRPKSLVCWWPNWGRSDGTTIVDVMGACPLTLISTSSNSDIAMRRRMPELVEINPPGVGAAQATNSAASGGHKSSAVGSATQSIISFAILLEDGTDMLLENGDQMLLEAAVGLSSAIARLSQTATAADVTGRAASSVQLGLAVHTAVNAVSVKKTASAAQGAARAWIKATKSSAGATSSSAAGALLATASATDSTARRSEATAVVRGRVVAPTAARRQSVAVTATGTSAIAADSTGRRNAAVGAVVARTAASSGVTIRTSAAQGSAQWSARQPTVRGAVASIKLSATATTFNSTRQSAAIAFAAAGAIAADTTRRLTVAVAAAARPSALVTDSTVRLSTASSAARTGVVISAMAARTSAAKGSAKTNALQSIFRGAIARLSLSAAATNLSSTKISATTAASARGSVLAPDSTSRFSVAVGSTNAAAIALDTTRRTSSAVGRGIVGAVASSGATVRNHCARQGLGEDELETVDFPRRDRTPQPVGDRRQPDRTEAIECHCA